MRRPERAMLGRIGLGVLGVAVVLQVLPGGAPRTNPPVLRDAPWPDARARSLAVGACYACHSNQTRWPASSYVAPVKWLVTGDVERGRQVLNFSEWDEFSDQARHAAETVAGGGMPPVRYQLLHAGARLTAAERQLLVEALAAMPSGGDRGGDSGDSGGGRGSG